MKRVPGVQMRAAMCFALASFHHCAFAQDWRSLSLDPYREVRVDSIAETWPFVQYEARNLPISKGFGREATYFLIEGDCESGRRRQAYRGFSLDSIWTEVERQTALQKAELLAVCTHRRGGYVSWKASAEPPVPPADSTSPRPQPTPAPLPPPRGRGQPNSPSSTETVRSSGSGFLVGPQLVVTNYHVIEGCTTVRVRRESETFGASVRASTERNDLAAIALDRSAGLPASLRASALLGEDIVVAGHPLAGLLSSDLVVTSGQVNSLAGIGNDPNLLQISAPVQPGSSGGPMIDRSGAVVGVVVSKLNVERLSKFTGDVAQNVNFAIKPEVLRLFLDTNRLQYRTVPIGARQDGTVLAERARQFTVQVLCEK